MANVSPEVAQPTETQRAETAANRFYDMADKAKAEEARYPQEQRYKEEKLSDAGRETAQGNFSGAQHVLESGAQIWDDNLRGAASEINQLDQEKREEKPMSFAEAQKAIGGYARLFEGDKDPKAAAEIDSIVGGTSRPGVEGIDEALKYIEGTLHSKASTADIEMRSKERASEFLKDLQEKRAIRDALFQEKQRRVEQGQQAQRATKEVTEARGSTTSGLENMFEQAGVPKDLPSRQELVSQAGRMSPEEIHLFDAALKKAATEFGRTRDPALLQARLEGLGGKSWKRADVERRQKLEDQRKIEEIRRKIGLPEQQPAKETEKKPEQKADEVKDKFVTFRDRFVNQIFQDPTVREDFDDFVNSNPTTQQYEAARASLSQLFREYMTDKQAYRDRMEPGGRFVSEKILKYREKFREVADTFYPDRLKFNYFLDSLQSDLGKLPDGKNLTEAFGALYVTGAKPSREQWKNASEAIAKFARDYASDRRPRSDKDAEWIKKLEAFAKQDFLPKK